jgi:hypothetical protein
VKDLALLPAATLSDSSFVNHSSFGIGMEELTQLKQAIRLASLLQLTKKVSFHKIHVRTWYVWYT